MDGGNEQSFAIKFCFITGLSATETSKTNISLQDHQESSLSLCTERSLNESDGTRGCTYAILTLEDERNNARNMYRHVIDVLK
jgi:hypothetical protein